MVAEIKPPQKGAFSGVVKGTLLSSSLGLNVYSANVRAQKLETQ